MKQKLKGLNYKVPMAARGLAAVLQKPRYAVLAFGFALAFALLMYLVINGSFYWPLFVSRLPFADKLSVFGDMTVAMGKSFVTTFEGAMLLVISLMQGAAFSVMVYTMRRNKRIDTKTMGGGTIAMVAAALGLGCVPCGTSLIMPIVTLFASGGAYAAANTASLIVLAIALILSFYSLYRLGFIAYAHTQAEYHDKKEEHEQQTSR